MRQPPNGKRSRNRPGRGNRPPHSRNHTFDSSGPEGKVRGTANQVYEKYLALARDASSSGDRIMAENFFQHAEHYFRIMAANGQQMRPRPNGFGDETGEDEGGETENAAASAGQPGQPQPRVEAEEPSQSTGGKPETPAELAQAAAANEGGRGRTGRPRRGPRRNGDATAEA